MNLSIPDAAAELAVSAPRLLRGLLEIAAQTSYEHRESRRGIRKTMVLPPESVEQLRSHFSTQGEAAAAPSPHRSSTPTAVRRPTHTRMDRSQASAPNLFSAQILDQDLPSLAIAADHSVPIAQFNALLYQHNVLREEIFRLSDYVDGCDRLLGEIVTTISTLEARVSAPEIASSPSHKNHNGVSGALRNVAAGFQSALMQCGSLQHTAGSRG